jgi:hypothetical protein
MMTRSDAVFSHVRKTVIHASNSGALFDLANFFQFIRLFEESHSLIPPNLSRFAPREGGLEPPSLLSEVPFRPFPLPPKARIQTVLLLQRSCTHFICSTTQLTQGVSEIVQQVQHLFSSVNLSCVSGIFSHIPGATKS